MIHTTVKQTNERTTEQFNRGVWQREKKQNAVARKRRVMKIVLCRMFRRLVALLFDFIFYVCFFFFFFISFTLLRSPCIYVRVYEWFVVQLSLARSVMPEPLRCTLGYSVFFLMEKQEMYLRLMSGYLSCHRRYAEYAHGVKYIRGQAKLWQFFGFHRIILHHTTN